MDRVTICNIALAKVGEQRIVSLNDNTKNAILCRLHFQPTLDEVLRRHRWNSAIGRATLAAVADTDADYEWTYAYALPVDCLRVIRLQDPMSQFAVEGRFVRCDESPCRIVYIRRIEDENILDPLLVRVVTIELAIKLAYNLTETRTMVEGLSEEATQAWVDARSADSHEGTPEVLEYSEWLESRIKGPSIGKAENARFRDIESGV